MELKHIRVFVAAFDEGSINRAAQRLGSSQPRVSALIRSLEHTLQTTLFQRRSTGIVPTPEGESFYRHAQRMLAELDAAQRAISARQGTLAGPLRVGLAPTITEGILPDILPGFLDTYPAIDFKMTEGFSGKLIDWTLAGEIDFAIVAIPPDDRRLRTRRIASEPVVLVTAQDRGPAATQGLQLQDGPPLQLALPWASNSLRQILDRFIGSGQIPVARIVEMDSLWGILDLVRGGGWETLLPPSALRNLDGPLRALPVADPHIWLEFFQISPARAALSEAARVFTDLVIAGFESSAARRPPGLRATMPPPSP